MRDLPDRRRSGDGRPLSNVYNTSKLNGWTADNKLSCPADMWAKVTVDAHRASTMVFKAGQPLFILDDPQGIPWVMQAMSQIKDPTLTYDGLKDLGSKLQLPAGWKFRVKVIDQDLTIGAVNGLAKITQDDLENTYDGCFPGMCSFVP